MTQKKLKIAIVGGGWSGMAAAVTAVQSGHTVTVFEASAGLGGRARALRVEMPNRSKITLDNGQHILIGAYSETLRLMRTVGVNPETSLKRIPLTLRYPDGRGLAFAPLPRPFNALVGIMLARGWSWEDKKSLISTARDWQKSDFVCPSHKTVAELSKRLTPTVMQTLINPLCLSALNTPPDRASRQMFLTVLRDALFSDKGASDMLLPTTDLASLFPKAAADWLDARRSTAVISSRVERLTPVMAKGSHSVTGWRVNDRLFDTVIWATSSTNAAAAMVENAPFASESIADAMQAWAASTDALTYESIATVYAHAQSARLRYAITALGSNAHHPAQFVIDRGQLSNYPDHKGVLAFVASACQDDRETLQDQVVAQAREQLGLEIQPIQTVVEKRATFACTPGLVRPLAHIAPSLFACGDYIAGPYPSTLEGAVRSGVQVARGLNS